jgi:hypothetical protein
MPTDRLTRMAGLTGPSCWRNQPVRSLLQIPNGAPDRVVRHPRIDLRRGDLPVPERPLHQVQVTCLVVQGVTKVWRRGSAPAVCTTY